MQSEAYKNHVRWMRLRGMSPDTIIQRTGALRRLAAAHDGRPLLDLTEEELMGWAYALLDRGLAAATRAVNISHVRSFYAWAYAEHHIPRDPAANLPVPRAPQRQARPISEAQLMVALERCDGTQRVWLVLAAFCGLRAKEVALLRGENVRLHDDPPYLLVASDATKGRRERIVPIPPYAVEQLERYQLPRRGPCWTGGHGQPVTPNFVSLVSNRYLHALGVEDTFHKLRTRFATQSHRAVHDIRITQELLGHSSPATTAIYTQVTDADKYRAVTLIPAPQQKEAV